MTARVQPHNVLTLRHECCKLSRLSKYYLGTSITEESCDLKMVPMPNAQERNQKMLQLMNRMRMKTSEGDLDNDAESEFADLTCDEYDDYHEELQVNITSIFSQY